MLMCGELGLLFSLVSTLYPALFVQFFVAFCIISTCIFLSPIFCIFFFYLLLWILRLSTRLDAIFYFLHLRYVHPTDFAYFSILSVLLVTSLSLSLSISLCLFLSHFSFGQSSRWGLDISPDSDCKGWWGKRKGEDSKGGWEDKSFGLAYKFYLWNNL